MRNPQEFDYDAPTRDALAGIYVEVSDSAAEDPAAGFNAARGETVVPAQVQQLFGLTLTVDDNNMAAPKRRDSSFPRSE